MLFLYELSNACRPCAKAVFRELMLIFATTIFPDVTQMPNSLVCWHSFSGDLKLSCVWFESVKCGKSVARD